MKERVAGLVIRTAFNNQGWAGRCKHPLNDQRCFKCRDGRLFVNWGKPIEEDEHGICKGNPENYPLSGDGKYWCWEQVLCKKYFWGNVKGKWRQVSIGIPVYFVYGDLDNTLTLWGHSIIENVDNEPDEYPPIFFKPFVPMPQSKWIKGLTGREITGKSWRQLHFRYLDEIHENYLASLVEGKGNYEHRKNPIHSLESYENLSIELKRDIKEKLDKIARVEGREVKELIREAVAKLIRERGA
ncbi:MAG: ribbon-helix-helix domain-containing protein [Thermodesulfovibrionales bacterium]|nr:ribbon-helix-helix domain-containing protein [Thermodesulfovibrionales bacterium]